MSITAEKYNYDNFVKESYPDHTIVKYPKYNGNTGGTDPLEIIDKLDIVTQVKTSKFLDDNSNVIFESESIATDKEVLYKKLLDCAGVTVRAREPIENLNIDEKQEALELKEQLENAMEEIEKLKEKPTSSGNWNE
jgi:hypothetical protein